MISPDKIDEVRNANDIVEVAQGYLQLRKSGSNFKACCPFHQEKTASFIVSPEKQIYHCFGCGAGGNVFTFIQKLENITFVESVKMLARRAGITVEEERGAPRDRSEKDKLLAANDEAVRFFREQFASSEKAKAYAASRGLDPVTLEDFKIGYAPDSWDGLCSHLKSKNIAEEFILKSSLGGRREGASGIHDTFRDRLMFPIYNIYNEVIAFGGRMMPPDRPDSPKYINSRETAIYVKGRNLYNLNNARRHAGGTIVIVEGYMDCVTVYAAGIKNVVASLGTALTADQAKMLKRYCEKVVVMYDMDDAGRQGAARAGDNLFAEGLDTYVVSFDGVKDPDEFIVKFGVEELRKKIENPESYIDYRISLLKKQGDMTNPYYKEKVLEELSRVVNKIESPVVRSEASKKIADRLYLSRELTARYFGGKAPESDAVVQGEELYNAAALKEKGIGLAEKMILSIALNCLGTDDRNVLLKHIAERMENLGLKYGDFRNPAFASIMDKINGYFKAGEKDILKKIEMDYMENEEISGIISGILAENSVQSREAGAGTESKKSGLSNKMQIIGDCFSRIQKEKSAYSIELLNSSISEAEAAGDTEKLNILLKEKTEMQIKLKTGGD
ncbi:MAG: DNA primase [Spirochaetia bacterium]|nr:DNA primase [Spirochaetia bacterium]